MKSRNKSRIEVSPDTGRKSLIVFYDSDDFDEAIKQAVAFHNILPGQMNVIAYPRGFEGGKYHRHFGNAHTQKK